MLVLSRKLNQSIRIGDNISLSIVRIKGNVVQLGIEAPAAVPILRSELLQRDKLQTAPASDFLACPVESSTTWVLPSRQELR
jgi:carbon storage regulator